MTPSPQALKFGWNSVFTPDSSVNGACDVSSHAVEALIDRTRGIASAYTQSTHDSEPNRDLFEGQQCSVASFNIEQPLVSTHLLNGEKLDESASEDDVQAIAASWNQSRFALRVADAMPIYARCFATLFSLFFVDLFLAYQLAESRCRTAGPTTMLAWHAVMAASFSYATCAPLHITSSALAPDRFDAHAPSLSHVSLLYPSSCSQVPSGRWSCPHHFCCVCEKKSQDCSNCLFRRSSQASS